jgi:3-phosphoshikimate 1-carboxyvinyltransferase
MKLTVHPGNISGTIEAPASKSSMQRALAAALIRTGDTIIQNPGISNDDMAALENIQKLGAKVDWENGTLKIRSEGVNPIHDIINCGESGLGIRMFTPLTALSDRKLTVTGTGSLTTRPMNFFDEIFPRLGISIKSTGGKLPMEIQGPLEPANIEVDGSLSSQFLTGLLMAYSAAGARDVTITVKDLKSKPYIDLTLKVLHDFGWEVNNDDHKRFYFPGNQNTIEGHVNYRVEGDWSGAAFLLVAGAISLSKDRNAGSIIVTGLDPQSTQADRAVIQAMISADTAMSIRDGEIEIRKSKLKAFQFDATECPDLFPPLVALASYCEGKSVISGAGRLTHKESNRALTLQEEFGKMGVQIDLQDDLMIIHGGAKLKGTAVHSHHDHRIAMACAVAAIAAEGDTEIEEADAVKKSYPDFYDDMRNLGAVIN